MRMATGVPRYRMYHDLNLGRTTTTTMQLMATVAVSSFLSRPLHANVLETRTTDRPSPSPSPPFSFVPRAYPARGFFVVSFFFLRFEGYTESVDNYHP